jgi:hypothetical protein
MWTPDSHASPGFLSEIRSLMILIAILGMLVPGYAVARAMRSTVGMALSAAFPLSALLLTVTLIAYTYFGVPIRFASVLGAIAIVTVASLALIRRTAVNGATPNEASSGPAVPRWLRTIVIVQVGIVLAGVSVKSSLLPLAGPDTPFRWHALAQMMLDDEGLLHYPPVTSDDFRSYFFPDGIPPLVSTVYWWLYAACGQPCPRLTSVAVGLQAVSCFALVYYAAHSFCGTMGGLLALAALSSSGRFLVGVVIGQETGYTALSVAGQLAFAFAAVREPRPGLVSIAGMFGGLASLSRDYGPFLSLCGASVLASWPGTRRWPWLFCAVSAACAAPWYLRNWLITGNPLYPMDVLGLGFPTNTIHAALHAMYSARIGLESFTLASWAQIAAAVFLGAPVALSLGVCGIVLAGRNGIALAISTILVCLLWIWSIPYTLGGVDLSIRVLLPAFVAMSIAAAAMAPVFSRPLTGHRTYLRAIIGAALVASGGYAALTCWCFPGRPWEIRRAALFAWTFPEESLISKYLPTAEMLEKTDLPPAGVLTDNLFFAVALQRSKRFHPVSIFSPEVAFVFDKQLDPADVRRRLREKGIWFVSMAPENLDFLQQFPFYHDDQGNWMVVKDDRNVYPIYFLPQ